MATTTSATRDETLRQIAVYAGVLADGYPDMRRDLQRGVEGIDIAWAGFERGRRQMFIRLCELMPDVAELCREVCKHEWPFPLGRTGPHGLTGRADDVDWDQAIAELRRIDVAATHRAASGATTTTPDSDEPTQAEPEDATLRLPEHQDRPGGMLGIGDLEKHFNLDAKETEALRKRLERWRPAHCNGEWIEVAPCDRRPQSAKYLYATDAVEPLVRDIRNRRLLN